jgi:hypothetical protein
MVISTLHFFNSIAVLFPNSWQGISWPTEINLNRHCYCHTHVHILPHHMHKTNKVSVLSPVQRQFNSQLTTHLTINQVSMSVPVNFFTLHFQGNISTYMYFYKGISSIKVLLFLRSYFDNVFVWSDWWLLMLFNLMWIKHWTPTNEHQGNVWRFFRQMW